MHYQPNGTRRMGVLRDKRGNVEERGGVEGRCNLERGCITLFGRRSRGTNCLPSAVCSAVCRLKLGTLRVEVEEERPQ